MIPHNNVAMRGMTLIELVIAMVIISIALAGLLVAYNRSMLATPNAMIQQQAIAIAKSYMEEILAKPYLDPSTQTQCPTPPASRAAYNNICDYNGLNDADAHDQWGNSISGLNQYNVKVTVDSVAAQLDNMSGNTVMRIDVNVIYSPFVNFKLSSYVTNSGIQ